MILELMLYLPKKENKIINVKVDNIKNKIFMVSIISKTPVIVNTYFDLKVWLCVAKNSSNANR